MVATVRLIECGFHFPTQQSSGGKQHTAAAWKWLDRSLKELADLVHPARMQVHWHVEPVTWVLTEEPIQRYVVALPRRHMRHLRSLLASACVVFVQTQIYLSVAGHVEYVLSNHNERR